MAKTDSSRKARTVTGIEYGKKVVRIATVSVSRSGKVTVRGLTQAVTPPVRRAPDEEGPSGRQLALKEALSKHIKDQGDVIVGIPREDVIARLVSLPSADPAEVREMLFFDVERYLPFPPDEAEISYRILEQAGPNESHVLMVAARRTDLYQVLEELDEVGVEPLRLDVEVNGCGYAFARGSGETDGEPFAVFHLDQQSSLVALVMGRQLRFSRATPIAVDDLASTAVGLTFEGDPSSWPESQSQWWGALVRNLKRSLTGFSHETFGTHPSRLILSGPGSELPGISQALEREISIPVIHRLPVPAGKTTEPLLFYSCPIGLALEEIESHTHINLVPEEIYQERAVARRKQFLVNSTILMVFNLILLGAWVGHQFWNKHQIIKIYENKIAEIQPQIRGIDEIDKKLKVIHANIDRDNSAFKVLQDLFTRTPDRVKVMQLDFVKTDSVVMSLETYSGADMDGYVKILGDSEYFAGTIDGGRRETIDLRGKKGAGAYEVDNYQKVTGTKCTLKSNPKLTQ